MYNVKKRTIPIGGGGVAKTAIPILLYGIDSPEEYYTYDGQDHLYQFTVFDQEGNVLTEGTDHNGVVYTVKYFVYDHGDEWVEYNTQFGFKNVASGTIRAQITFTIDPAKYYFDDPENPDDYTQLKNQSTYIITSNEWAIKPATITVQIENQTKKQGQADPELSWYVVSGVVGSQTPGWTGFVAREAGEAPGRYTIRQNTLQLADGKNGFLESNYELVVIPGGLVITPPETTPGGDGGPTP